MGRCGQSDQCRIASIGPHFGEEPPLSGTRGSGTLFFSGCSCGCFFCQNVQISQEGVGALMANEELWKNVRQLIDSGVHNLNFVTPDHFWPHCRTLCERLRAKGIDIPTVFNGSGYHKPAMVDEYAKYFDIFLPDMKFMDRDLAQMCMGDANYADYALKSIEKMVNAVGFLRPWDEAGAEPAKKGVMVRHLVLPGHSDDSCAVLARLLAEFGPDLPLSVMSQYHPMPECIRRGQLIGRVQEDEYENVCNFIYEAGFEHVFVQDGVGDDAYLPDFEADDPFG